MNIGKSKIFKTIIKCCVDIIGIVAGSMSHKDQCTVCREIGELLADGIDDLHMILLCGKKRITKSDAFKTIFERKSIFFHQIIFNTIDHMGRLYDHFCDAVCDHLFHGFGYVVDPDIVPFQKFCHDHFTGPGTVNLIIREMFSDALFNHIDGLFAGIRKTGTETDHQNRFSCFRHKVLFLSSIVIISSVCSVPLLITFCQLSVEKTV